MTTKGARILGVGLELPDDVRDNSWWDARTVASWRTQSARRLAAIQAWAASDDLTPGQRLLVDALTSGADDAFGGSRQRRVASPEVASSDMEVLAARRALEQAAIAPQDVDLVLGYAGTPDVLVTPNVCRTHELLGLRRDVLSLDVNAACNTVAAQLDLAQLYIRTGRARYVLCVQSALPTRLMSETADYSAWFGDAATAFVLGPDPVEQITVVHRTDGRQHGATMATVTGKHWYDEGRVYWQTGDRGASREMLVSIADFAAEAVATAVAEAGQTLGAIDFYASHQGTGWFREVTQKAAGLGHARTFDAFPVTGSTWACNIPVVLALGAKEGLLRPGDLVATFAGGAGTTYSATVFRYNPGG